MMDTVTYYALPTSSGMDIEYTCKLIEITDKRLDKAYRRAVTDIVVFSRSLGYRRFSVALPAGLSLYMYLQSSGRFSRLDDIIFKLTVQTVSQKVIAVKAYDPQGWINGDNVRGLDGSSDYREQ